MKRVLILAYYYPPGNFAGSYRVQSWFKYMHTSGIYPVIITRNWNPDQTELTDEIQDNDVKVIKGTHGEIHYLPYNQNLRDKLHNKNQSKPRIILRKVLTLLELILQNFTFRVIPYRNILQYADDYLTNQSGEIKCIIASGRPFQLFGFADKLSRKHKITWIADYRDDWNTVQWKNKLSFLQRFILRLESRSEKRWLKSAACFITVSEPLKKHIGSFIRKEGYVIMNGFDPSDYPDTLNVRRDTFRIVYNGTLYASQDLEGFMEGFRMFLEKNNRPRDIELIFAGTGTDEKQMSRIFDSGESIREALKVTRRLPKSEVISIQSSASVLVMLSHPGTKGNYSSKIFEYLALRIPVLLYPGDKDVLSDIIRLSREGSIADNSMDVCNSLQMYYDRFLSNSFMPAAEPGVYPYTRERLCADFCTIIQNSIK